MEVLLGLGEIDRSRERAAAIGIFDGLHRGHRALLGRLVREADRIGATATVVTFDPHPDAILRGAAPPRVGDPAQLLEGLAALGVDEVVVQPFDRRFAELDPQAFLRLVGAGRGLRAFVMTPGTAFGHERRGDATTVARLGEQLGFRLVLVEPVIVGGRPVSSERIRAAIAAGRLAEARRFLGRGVTATGIVVAGAGRGEGLGFPTANVELAEPAALPPDGIYAVRARWRTGTRVTRSRRGREAWRSGLGVASLGLRPTFGPGERVLEVHLFDLDESLYGATMRVEFVRRQRTERRFRSAASLVRQMERDAARARRVLGIC